MYRILGYSWYHRDDGIAGWHDVGEGPFDSAADAIEFADAEVGIPWVVVGPDNKPIAFGDAVGQYGAKPSIPDSTCGWAE